MAAEVDKTGLDILCRGKGDTYIPPKNGISVCLRADGTIIICDSKTDKCSRAVPDGHDKPPVVEEAMTFRLMKLVKELSDRVDLLESRINGGRMRTAPPAARGRAGRRKGSSPSGS